MKSEPIYELSLKYQFSTNEARNAFVADMTNDPPLELAGKPLPIAIRRDFMLHYTACKLCGIPKSFQTLGSGLVNQPADECRDAHKALCRTRQDTRQYLSDES